MNPAAWKANEKRSAGGVSYAIVALEISMPVLTLRARLPNFPLMKVPNSKQRLKIVFCIAAAMACGSASRGEEPVTLVREGRPLCHIVVGPGSPKSARFGAEELRWHIRKMTGAEIPILDSPAPQGAGIPIYVGESPALDADGGGGTSGFQSQEYRVSVAKDRILLAGKDSEDNGAFRYDMEDPAGIAGLPDMWISNGSLYAVYDFLERHCGVRWFNQTESGTFVPDKKDLSVPCGELRRRPAFVYRNALNPGEPNSYDSYNRYIALWSTMRRSSGSGMPWRSPGSTKNTKTRNSIRPPGEI